MPLLFFVDVDDIAAVYAFWLPYYDTLLFIDADDAREMRFDWWVLRYLSMMPTLLLMMLTISPADAWCLLMMILLFAIFSMSSFTMPLRFFADIIWYVAMPFMMPRRAFSLRCRRQRHASLRCCRCWWFSPDARRCRDDTPCRWCYFAIDYFLPIIDDVAVAMLMLSISRWWLLFVIFIFAIISMMPWCCCWYAMFIDADIIFVWCRRLRLFCLMPSITPRFFRWCLFDADVAAAARLCLWDAARAARWWYYARV